MSGFCDRCNEKAGNLINIVNLPELAAVAHLGYRQVCGACYDDLEAEADEAAEQEEDRRAERRVRVAIKAIVEGNTSHLESFSDEMTIEEISPSGLRLRTARELDTGALLKIIIATEGFDTAALVQTVWGDEGQRSIGLKVVEPGEDWNRLWELHAEE